MKTKNYNLKHAFLIALLGSTILLGSCDDGDSNSITEPDPNPFYSLGTIVGDVSYILSTDDLAEGNITPVGNGVEFGTAEFINSGKYIYFFSRDEKKFFQYELNADGSVTEIADLLVTQYVTDRAYSQNLIGDNTILVLDPVQWGEPEIKWFTISIPDFVITDNGSFDLPALEQSAGVNWKANVGLGALHGNKFIMGTVYYDFDGNTAEGAHAVVLDYPFMSNPTLISTDLLDAELGIVSNNGFAAAENGDLYIAAHSGDVWGKPAKDGIHGALLRIKNGETEFDSDYLLDFTEVIGETTNIMQLDYLGNNTAMAMLFDDTEVDGWSDLDNDHYFFAKVDLDSKSLTKYNISNSAARLGRRPLVEDGKYISYFKSTTNSTTQVLEIDPEGDANDFTIGTQIEGDNVQGYSVAKHPAE